MEERAQRRGRKGQGMTLLPPTDEVFGKKPFESTFPKFLSSSAENPCRDRIGAKSKGKDCLALIYQSLDISNQQITVIFDLVWVPERSKWISSYVFVNFVICEAASDGLELLSCHSQCLSVCLQQGSSIHRSQNLFSCWAESSEAQASSIHCPTPWAGDAFPSLLGSVLKFVHIPWLSWQWLKFTAHFCL